MNTVILKRSMSGFDIKHSYTENDMLFKNFNNKALFFTADAYELLQSVNSTTLFSKFACSVEYNQDYLATVHVIYGQGNIKSAGKQMHYNYNDHNDYELLLDDVKLRLETLIARYAWDLKEQMIVRIVLRKVDKRFITDVFKESGLNVEIKKPVLSSFTRIPFTYENDLLGVPLNPVIVENDLREVIIKSALLAKYTKYDNKDLDILALINKNNKNITFTPEHKFYLRNVLNPYYVLVILVKDSTTFKWAFSLQGNLITHVQDIALDNNSFKRLENKSTMHVVNKVVISYGRDITFDGIDKGDRKSLYLSKNISSFIPNQNIGVIDLETYVNEQGIAKVYSCGFKTSLNDKPICYYIDKETLDSDKLILMLIDELLREKYSNIKFFIHNLGNFDGVFLLKTLCDFNDANKSNPYVLDAIFRDNTILKLVIKRKGLIKGSNKLAIHDSLPLLSKDLRSLAQKFNVSTQKGYFPYNFVSENTLFYKGDIPSINYYENIDEATYKALITNTWDLKSVCLKYLEDDLNSLYQVIKISNDSIFKLFNMDLVNSTTISGLALNIFLKKYYKNKTIPLITDNKIFKDIKCAYYGGQTEVYRPIGEKLYYYDVNSLYPYVALQDMPGCECVYYEKCNKSIDELFGFFYCDIDAPLDLYIGVLPYKRKDGNIYPVGKWSGWYYSEELKYAKSLGYKITVLKGYSFNRVKDVFHEYIHTIYKMKKEALNTSDRELSKSSLNNLLGRFGLNFNKPVTQIVTHDQYMKISCCCEIYSELDIYQNYKLISHDRYPDTELTEKFGIDLNKAFDKLDHLSNNAFKSDCVKIKHVYIAIAACITALGRIHINKIKYAILKSGGSTYYSDTDSIVSNIQLGADYVSFDELGKLKLEAEIKKGIFISGKTYYYENTNKSVI